MIFRTIPLDFSLKFLWIRCDFHMPRMVYVGQTDDFVVKNVKKCHFLDIYDIVTQNDVSLRFLNNSIGFLVEIRIL